MVVTKITADQIHLMPNRFSRVGGGASHGAQWMVVPMPPFAYRFAIHSDVWVHGR